MFRASALLEFLSRLVDTFVYFYHYNWDYLGGGTMYMLHDCFGAYYGGVDSLCFCVVLTI